MTLNTFTLAAAILVGGYFVVAALDAGLLAPFWPAGQNVPASAYAAAGGLAMLLVLLIARSKR